MSTKPGAMTRPSQSTVRAASSDASRLGSSTMRPSAIPTSARRRGAPVPSTISPPRRRTSSMSDSASCQLLANFGFHRRPVEERRVGAGEVVHGVGEHEVAEVLLCYPLVLHHLPRLFEHFTHVRHVPVRHVRSEHGL